MKTKYIVSIFVIFVIVIVFFIGNSFYEKNNSIIINFKNNSNVDIEKLELSYTGLSSNIEVPTIKGNNTFQFKVEIDKNFHEGSMKLYCTDKNNQKVEAGTIIGYFEKGYHGTVDVDIDWENEQVKASESQVPH